MSITLLDGSMKVEIFFELNDCEYGDNICIKIIEQCPDDERVFRGDETNLYLTPKQARKLSSAFLQAAEESEKYCTKKKASENEKSLQA